VYETFVACSTSRRGRHQESRIASPTGPAGIGATVTCRLRTALIHSSFNPPSSTLDPVSNRSAGDSRRPEETCGRSQGTLGQSPDLSRNPTRAETSVRSPGWSCDAIGDRRPRATVNRPRTADVRPEPSTAFVPPTTVQRGSGSTARMPGTFVCEPLWTARATMMIATGSPPDGPRPPHGVKRGLATASKA